MYNSEDLITKLIALCESVLPGETTKHPASGRLDKSVINIYTDSIRVIGTICVRNIKTRKHY